VRIFVAGASGLIGSRLTALLIEGGHLVAAMTRSREKAATLAVLGADAVVCDVFDSAALTEVVIGFAPDIVVHQLTDLPDDISDLEAFGRRNARIRTEGTRNLIAAAAAAGAERVIAQSISWELPADRGRAVTGEHERLVLEAGGVVVRYGQFWGPGTYFPDVPPAPPRIHLDDAARLTLPALSAPAGITVVVDDRALPQQPPSVR
jgi:nucleoside-diphosphate-sugar epimerase